MSSAGSRALILVMFVPLLAGCADDPRLVAEDPDTGFALYRSGRLSATDLGVLCDLGVEEILVLNGDGGDRECRLQETVCPDLRVRYDRVQEANVPVSTDFLMAFDTWIEKAKDQGKKVAFRCRHGWHRTGRLAAYYRMRFEGASATEATQEMQRIGRLMWRHPSLDSQVEAYADWIANRPCSVDPADCPVKEPDPGLVEGRFPIDACGASGS